MLKTKKSNPGKPPIVMIYGREGTGKSTLGARAPKPVFISPEGGCDRLTTAEGHGVDEMPNVNNWVSLRSAVKQVLNEEHSFETLVIDSADWIEKLAHAQIIGSSDKTIITAAGGYGSGYRQSEQMHRDLISELTEIREKRNMNIIVCAHAHVKQAKDPEMMHDYDTYEIKGHEFVTSIWREWVESLLFVRFKTYTKTSEHSDKARALGTDERVVYTVQRPAFQAKNRFGLPSEMPFTLNFWNDFYGYAMKGAKPETIEEVRDQVSELFKKLEDGSETKVKAMAAINDGYNDLTKLKANRDRLREILGVK